MGRYERFDGCRGTVTSKAGKGVFLELDNGEHAFAYKFNLPSETKVICTVLKPAEGELFTRVSIDAVDYMAA
mgnify:CR=1 FL=1